jgi:phage portal protein BeeE
MNAGRPMLLDGGLKWEQLTIDPVDAQLLESRKFSGEEICRIFRVPPAMVGFGDKSSNWGTGKEVDVLGFVKFSLLPRLKRIEQALMKQLLTPRDRAEGITIEFNLEGLLRGDSDGRAQFYERMTRIGAMTINEVRRLENLPPVEGGDVPRMQMQNVPITEATGIAPGQAGAGSLTMLLTKVSGTPIEIKASAMPARSRATARSSATSTATARW